MIIPFISDLIPCKDPEFLPNGGWLGNTMKTPIHLTYSWELLSNRFGPSRYIRLFENGIKPLESNYEVLFDSRDNSWRLLAASAFKLYQTNVVDLDEDDADCI